MAEGEWLVMFGLWAWLKVDLHRVRRDINDAVQMVNRHVAETGHELEFSLSRRRL